MRLINARSIYADKDAVPRKPEVIRRRRCIRRNTRRKPSQISQQDTLMVRLDKLHFRQLSERH